MVSAGESHELQDVSVESSRVALRAITNMTLDIADSHADLPSHLIDTLPPTFAYIIRKALHHTTSGVLSGNGLCLQDVERRLRVSLAQFSRRWGIPVTSVT
jgi:hypothetical protein